MRGRLVDPILGYELDGQEVTVAPDSDGGLWSRRRWGLKPLRRREGPSVQLHLHSPAGEEVCASSAWLLFVCFCFRAGNQSRATVVGLDGAFTKISPDRRQCAPSAARHSA